jgi:hypothetical protein
VLEIVMQENKINNKKFMKLQIKDYYVRNIMIYYG